MRSKDIEDLRKEMGEIGAALKNIESRIAAKRPTVQTQEASPRSPRTPVMKQSRTRGDLDRSYAFWIALTLILGFLVVILIPTLGQDVQSAKDLAAIFSGWIVAIVGFYFIQNQARQAVKYATGERGLEQGRSAVETMESAMKSYKKRNAELEENVKELGEALLETLPD